MSRIALIIGGASGIGLASAQALAASAHAVAIADIDGNAAHTVAGGLDGSHGFAVDVSAPASVADLFADVTSSLGQPAVLVVAAGVAGYVDGLRPTLRSMPVEAWDRVMAVNARGPFLCIQAMLRMLEQAPIADARIILVGSMAAQALAINSPASYVASKGALHALARSAAGEAASLGCTVNVVAPGAIDTPMLRSVMPANRDAEYFGRTVAGRAGNAEEIAAAVAWLASPHASYVNGATIDVNGGLLMR
jgi:3-oxoacyl-[acyl-carrier protein] reductase